MGQWSLGKQLSRPLKAVKQTSERILRPNTRAPHLVCPPPLLFASLGKTMPSQWLLGYGMYLNAWFKTLIHPSQIWQLFKHYCLNGYRCSAHLLLGRVFLYKKGEGWLFFSPIFFFRHTFYLYVCYQGLPRDASGPQIKNLTLLLPTHSFPSAFLYDFFPNKL